MRPFDSNAELGRVDFWINNAGTNAYKYNLLTDSQEEDIVSIVETNMLGVMLCSKEVSLILCRAARHAVPDIVPCCTPCCAI